MKSSLMIIDMQNDFVRPWGTMYVPGSERIIPNIVSLSAEARRHEIPVIHIIQEHRRQKVDYGLELFTSPLHCVEGTEGAKIIDELRRDMDDKNDYVVVKRRFSGFFGTDLDLLLRSLRVEKVYITGIVAEGCVRSTAADALQLGYRVVLVADCIAGLSSSGHEELLEFFRHRPDGVMNFSDICFGEER